MSLANKLGKQGQGGDDTVGHLDTGEIVLPKDITRDPKSRSLIGELLANKGYSLPEFEVGGRGDKINPRTGMREFRGSEDADAFGDEPGENEEEEEGPGGPGDDGSSDDDPGREDTKNSREEQERQLFLRNTN